MGGSLKAPVRRIGLAVVLLIAGLLAAVPSTRADTAADVWLQTMDSCQQALGGAGYQIVSTNGTNFTVATGSASPVTVKSTNGGCPLQSGNCATLSNGQSPVGCVDFPGLQPGTYTIHETATPPPYGTNSDGYATCTGGSACQQQYVTMVVNSDLTAQAWVTNVFPDGSTVCWPGGTTLPAGTTETCQQTGLTGYAGTPANPIVTHNFGVAPPGTDSSAPNECDENTSEPTADADDYLSGAPSSHCAYPEAQEGTWCGGDTVDYPFPWSCTLALQPTPSPSPPPATCSSPVTSYFSNTVGGDSAQSNWVSTATTGTLSANVTWSPLNSVALLIYTSSSSLLGQTAYLTTGNSTLTLYNMPAATYKIKVKNGGSTSITYQLYVSHC